MLFLPDNLIFYEIKQYIFKYITYIMPEEGNEFSAAPKVVRPKKKYKEKEP